MNKCSLKVAIVYAAFQEGKKTGVNVGTIGHVDMGKTTLSKAIDTALKSRGNKSDRKRDRANRWR